MERQGKLKAIAALQCIAGVAAIFLCPDARAIDCARAHTAVEKTICRDANLIQLDKRLSAAYAGLVAATAIDGRPDLLASQREWLKERDDCGTAQRISPCVATAIKARTALLEGRELPGSDETRRLIPLLGHHRRGPGLGAISYDLARFRRPKSRGEIYFNQKIDELIGGMYGEESGDGELQVTASMQVDWATRDFLSATYWQSVMEPGMPHPHPQIQSINVDMRRSREVQFADIFIKSAHAPLFRSCVDQIARYRREVEMGMRDPGQQKEDRQTIAESVADMSRWAFAKDGATIYFAPYEIGIYAEGQFECKFPVRVLRPFFSAASPYRP